jgi:hypothetical protein
MKPQITRGRLITLGILTLLAIVFYYLYSYSFLEIQGPADSYTYDLTNQKIGSDLVSGTATNTVRKLVKRGSYEALVKQTDKSYWSIVQTRFFEHK